jgi:hypothetical protein
MIQIDDLNRTRKMLVGEIPDPFGAVANGYLFLRAAPAPVPGFQIDSFAKLFGCFHGAGIGGRIGIADGITFCVPLRLREDASQLDFSRMRRLAVILAFPPLRFFLHHGHSRSVHLHIQNANRLADNDRQVQLDGFADFALLAGGDVGANRLRCPLHGFGGHLQTGQNLHLLTTAIERHLLSHRCLHAAHPGREVRIAYVSFTSNASSTGN